MPALIMALVANGKMLQHQFLPNAMRWTRDTNNISHLDFIPDGPGFAPRAAPTFSVANLDVKDGTAQKVRVIGSGHRADP